MPQQQRITGVIFESQHVFGGTFPDVPLAENVQVEELTAGDPDPVFVTLPIGAVGAASRNQRQYSEANIQAIIRAASNGADGIKGHLRDEERAYRFDVPSIVWVGAIQDSQGTAWGKAYVLQHAADVREYVKVKKKLNAPIGTSIYGTARIDDEGNVFELEVESIDLAHPLRVGVPLAAAVPVVTREQVTSEQVAIDVVGKSDNEEADMPDKNGTTGAPEAVVENTLTQAAHEQAVAEAVAQAREAVITEKRETERKLNARIAELENRIGDLNLIVKELNNPDDAVQAVREMKQQVADLHTLNGELLSENITAQVAASVVVEHVRPVIEALVRAEKPATREAVATTLKTVLEQEHIKVLLRQGVAEIMGPPVVNPTRKPGETSQTVDDFFPIGEVN